MRRRPPERLGIVNSRYFGWTASSRSSGRSSRRANSSGPYPLPAKPSRFKSHPIIPPHQTGSRKKSGEALPTPPAPSCTLSSFAETTEHAFKNLIGSRSTKHRPVHIAPPRQRGHRKAAHELCQTGNRCGRTERIRRIPTYFRRRKRDRTIRLGDPPRGGNPRPPTNSLTVVVNRAAVVVATFNFSKSVTSIGNLTVEKLPKW